MLASLHFANFKSWSRLDMPCARITGLFGTNSSGKSSILQFLLMLKQTKEATDRATALELNADYVRLGTIHDVAHQQKGDGAMEWRVEFDLGETLSLADPEKPKSAAIAAGTRLALDAAVQINRMNFRATRLSYSLGDFKFTLAPKNGDASNFELLASSAQHPARFAFLRTKGRPWQLPAPIKSYAFPDQARTYFQNAGFLADMEAKYEKMLDSLYYLGPLREYPQRDYLWARSRPTDVGLRGEKAIDAILAATESSETRNLKRRGTLLPFQEMIAHWLAHMGLVQGFRVEEIAEGSNRWQAKVRTREGGTEVLLTDVGFGVSQVLPVVTLLQYVPEGSTVILEQPEIHLHPLAQAALADVIIQAAQRRNVQILLESHSEHLLLRLQRRIAEGDLSARDVKLYFCDAPKGTSVLSELSLDIFGNIRNWPDRFMGDAFGETAKAELARLKRAKNAA